MKRVAVVGGGMAGLAAAWRLSSPELRDSFEVTVYERSWQLGGKGASGRGEHGRIEEHGLHVWLGYYDNAFALMREVYGDLDRASSDPSCPVRTWRDAFVPASVVGVEDWDGRAWQHWTASFAENAREPGVREERPATTVLARFVEQATKLLADFGQSLADPGPEDADPEPRVVLSASPYPPRRLSRDTRRTMELAGLVAACLRGTLADGLLWRDDGFEAIDRFDFREWLRRHGADEQTCESALVRGMYDLVFAYRDGDRKQPRFCAGLGLFLATRFFFDYKGAIFWRMTAGMGDVVFAPLYQALLRRGVRLRLMHRLDNVVLSENGCGVERLELTRLASVPDGAGLVDVKGLPCFPAKPDDGWFDGEVPVIVERPDAVVLAVSIGAIPKTCASLLARSARWRCMVEQVGTVATRSAQLWLRDSEAALGWRWPGATVSAYDEPFDTFASMTHLLPVEDWGDDGPESLAYLCAAIPDEVAAAGSGATADTSARVNEFLAAHARHFWPSASASASAAAGVEVVDRYERTSTDPSDRYVLSLPGSQLFRLRADESGVDGLVLAGDWTNCGLNAGCIEAAAMSGHQAANVVLGKPLTEDLLGEWYGLRG